MELSLSKLYKKQKRNTVSTMACNAEEIPCRINLLHYNYMQTTRFTLSVVWEDDFERGISSGRSHPLFPDYTHCESLMLIIYFSYASASSRLSIFREVLSTHQRRGELGYVSQCE
jgi:hypothetical protein